MKLKKLAASLAIVGAALVSSSANAYIIQDAWTMGALGSITSNIGHLNLSGGGANVIQETDALGNPFVGADFVEFGQIFTISYTAENLPGFNDFGPPQLFGAPLQQLQVEFVGLAGQVTGFNAGTGQIDYMFTPGVGSIVVSGTTDGINYDQLALLSLIAPSGGDLNDFFGAAQTTGNSTIIANFTAFLNGFMLDLAGPGVGYADVSDLYLQVQTNNKIGAPAVVLNADTCRLYGMADCAGLLITSDGSADLLKIPEPASLALTGLGLLGLGALRRRRLPC